MHVVDETADLADAASAILAAKSFDYATSCLADNALIVHADVYDELVARLTGSGAHLCDQQQKDALRAVMWPDGGAVPSITVVAKSAAAHRRAGRVRGRHRLPAAPGRGGGHGGGPSVQR